MLDMSDKEPELTLTDFDWVTASLAYALVSGLTLEDLEVVIRDAKTGEEFDAGVVALIDLRDMLSGDSDVSF